MQRQEFCFIVNKHTNYQKKLFSMDAVIDYIKQHTLNNPSYKWSPMSLQSGSIMPICRKRIRIRTRRFAEIFNKN
jgi:hypothetical protein